MSKTIIQEELESYIDYLIEDGGYKKLSELSRDERGKLFYLVLVDKRWYTEMIRTASNYFKKSIANKNK